jgi:transcription elongation factor GreB
MHFVSKAFTKEDADAPPQPSRRRGIPVPDPNFLTPEGAAAARAELDQLLRAAGDPDRVRELTEHLATAQIVGPADRETVGLGATVTIETAAGERRVYRFVGAIEADVKRGWLSFQTELANALWGARVGDSVELPRGDDVEIVAIAY